MAGVVPEHTRTRAADRNADSGPRATPARPAAATTAPTAPKRGAGATCPEGFVTAEMVASELARVTGKKNVPPSTVRAMAGRGQLPAPARERWGRRLLWRADEISAWMNEREQRHVPRDVVRRVQRRLTQLDEQARLTGNDARLKQGVRNARRRGLTFQQIADAIKVKNGDHHPTREAVRARFAANL